LHCFWQYFISSHCLQMSWPKEMICPNLSIARRKSWNWLKPHISCIFTTWLNKGCMWFQCQKESLTIFT
jgi:hypothetical protein